MFASTPQTTTTAAQNVPQIAGAVLAYVVDHIDETIELSDLASVVGLSDSNFCRQFTRDCGLSPMRWLWSFRAALAAEFIAIAPQWSLTDVAFSCGFGSSAHFSRQFKAVLGVSPSLYKRQRQKTLMPVAKTSTLLSADSDDKGIALRLATKLLTTPRPTVPLI